MGEDFLAKRRFFKAPVPEIFQAADLLDEAADAHLAGMEKKADALIARANMPVIREWTESLWGKQDQSIIRFREVANAPPYANSSHRTAGGRMPNAAAKARIRSRDRNRCRFCSIPLITGEVRAVLHKHYPAALPWGTRNAEQHAAFQCMWLQYDHVLPFQRGGDSSDDNVVLTCAGCNYARWYYTLDEVGLLDPRQFPVFEAKWDGLERVLGAAK